MKASSRAPIRPATGTSLLVSLFLILVSHSLNAQTWEDVFPPQSFVRGPGAPVVEELLFDVSSPGRGHLTVWTNRSGEPKRPVVSALVTLNGATLIDPSNFSPFAVGIERDVTLVRGENVLSIQIMGPPDSQLGVTLRAEPNFELDQFQEAIGSGLFLTPNAPRWQSFVPTLDDVTRVGVYLQLRLELVADLEIQIQEVDGEVLSSRLVEGSMWRNGWNEFEIPACAVVPGESYLLWLIPRGEGASWGLPDRDSPRAHWLGHARSAYFAGMSDAWSGYDHAFRIYGSGGGFSSGIIGRDRIVFDPR